MPADADALILLTGANGQLGCELLRGLRARGRVVAVVRPGTSPPPYCDFLETDFGNSDQIRHLVREVGPDVIVNAMAYTAVDDAEIDRDAAMTLNGIAPGVLAEEACKLNASLIHYSSDYVFNGQGTLAWRESDGPQPINFYGRSKLAGEEAIRRTGAAHWILRTSWLYGAYGHNFVKKMLQLAAERTEISVVNDQIGAPTSAPFVAAVTAQLISRTLDKPPLVAPGGGTLHVSCTGETSWHGLATTLFALTAQLEVGRPIPTLRAIPSAAYQSPARRPLNSRLNTDRLRQLLSMSPPRWDEELRYRLPEILGGRVQDDSLR